LKSFNIPNSKNFYHGKTISLNGTNQDVTLS
jgi:hypothetical protein